MKVKNYIILLLAACMWVSCSKDEDLPKGPDATPDAFLSLAVNADVKTKAESAETTDAPRNLIHRLSVFVYVGDFCYYRDSINKVEAIKSVESIPVKGGNAVILAVANASDAQINYLKAQKIGSTSADLSGCPDSDLANEKHGALTMSSERFSVTLKVSTTNCIGFTAEEVAAKNGVSISKSPISLYRTVARTQLSKLELLKDTEYGTAVSFKLKKVFTANVKSQSELLSKDGDGWGATEVPGKLADAAYWYGDSATSATGEPLKSILNGTLKEHLSYEFADGRYTDWTAFPYHEEEMTTLNGDIVLSAGQSFENTNINHPVGNFFYVYENSYATDAAQTLLIVCGDYTYIPKGGLTPITETDRYYALVVNGPENQSDANFSGVDKHMYIKRNTKYNISMKIAGPGSERPYTPSTRAYVGAKIEVLAWNTEMIKESVD